MIRARSPPSALHFFVYSQKPLNLILNTFFAPFSYCFSLKNTVRSKNGNNTLLYRLIITQVFVIFNLYFNFLPHLSPKQHLKITIAYTNSMQRKNHRQPRVNSNYANHSKATRIKIRNFLCKKRSVLVFLSKIKNLRHNT